MGDTEMSVINKMLQDLAQRQASSHHIPEQIEPLAPPPARKNRPLRIWLTGITLANIAVLAWFLHANVRKVAPIRVHTAVTQPAALTAAHPITPAPLTHINLSHPSVVTLATAPAIPAGAMLTHAAALKKPDPAPVAGIVSAASASPLTVPASASVGSSETLPPAAPSSTPETGTIPASPAKDAQTPADRSITIRKHTSPLTPAQLAQNEYVKAITLAQQGDMDGAIAGFTQVLTLDPHHHQARLMLAGLLIESKRFNEAESDLQIGLTQDPAQIDFATLLARLQVEHDTLAASVATLMHSLPYAANQADYQAFLAALLQRSGKNDQAIDHYVIALKQNPQSGVWWMGLGISEKAAGHVAEAHEAFARAKATNSLSPDLQAYVEQQLRQP